MTDRDREEYQARLCDLAESYVARAVANGEPYTESLSDWAMRQASQHLTGGV